MRRGRSPHPRAISASSGERTKVVLFVITLPYSDAVYVIEAEGMDTREYVPVLRLLETFSLSELTGAVEYALDIGVIDAAAVRVIAEHRKESPVAPLLTRREAPYGW